MCQKETYLHEKRPTSTKRDVSLQKETYTRDLLSAISVDSSEIRHCVRNYVSKKNNCLQEKKPACTKRDLSLNKETYTRDLLSGIPVDSSEMRHCVCKYASKNKHICKKRDLSARKETYTRDLSVRKETYKRDLSVRKETYTRDLMNAVFLSSSQIRHFASATTCEQDDLSKQEENQTYFWPAISVGNSSHE